MKKMMFALLAGLSAVGAAQAQTAASTSLTTADTAPHAYMGLGASAVGDTIGGGLKVHPKIFGGYAFDRNWGVEAGFMRFRTADFFYWDGNQQGTVADGQVKGYRSYAAGKYTVPINENFSAYGKFGLSYSVRKVSIPKVGLRDTERDTGLYAGLGAQYKLTKNVAAVVEYERYGKRKENGPKADVYSVGLKYGF